MSNRMADAIIGAVVVMIALIGVGAMVNFAIASDKGSQIEIGLLK